MVFRLFLLNLGNGDGLDVGCGWGGGGVDYETYTTFDSDKVVSEAWCEAVTSITVSDDDINKDVTRNVGRRAW